MSEVRIEWGVRRTFGDVGSVAGPMWRSEAKHAAATWPGELVSREVTYGEWTPAAGESAAVAASEEMA